MKNKTVWANRLKGKTSLSFQKIGSSISADKRLYEQDIAASIVHTKMLVKQKRQDHDNKFLGYMVCTVSKRNALFRKTRH